MHQLMLKMLFKFPCKPQMKTFQLGSTSVVQQKALEAVSNRIPTKKLNLYNDAVK
jgi:hypothetical protein